MDIKKKTSKKETTTIMLDHNDIIEFLESKGIHSIGAEITVHVPSGGDYSDTDLDIGTETLIKVKFTEETPQ